MIFCILYFCDIIVDEWDQARTLNFVTVTSDKKNLYLMLLPFEAVSNTQMFAVYVAGLLFRT